MKDIAKLEKAEDGWYFDPAKKVAHIKVKTKESNSSFSIHVSKDGATRY